VLCCMSSMTRCPHVPFSVSSLPGWAIIQQLAVSHCMTACCRAQSGGGLCQLLVHQLHYMAQGAAIVVSCAPGALVAYVNILADVLSSVAGSVIPPGAEPSRNALMAGITFFGALPIAILVHSPQVTDFIS